MTWNKDTVWCDGCGVEILWTPLVVGERDYCCEDCLAGLPCSCGEWLEMDEERRALAGAPEGTVSGTPIT